MKVLIQGIKYSIALFPLSFPAFAGESKPQLQLANNYDSRNDLHKFLVSEKYDGVRAYWDGKKLYTRQGNRIYAPQWFTRDLPPIALDGELWIDRQRFDEVSGIVRTRYAKEKDWQKVRFMVFDLPHSLKPFEARLNELKVITDEVKLPHLKTVPHFKVKTPKELQHQLSHVVAKGGEGLMLHRSDSFYQAVRSDDLQKLKPYDDAEATVLKHLPGKGKYRGKLGALLVKTSDGITFRIGSGFSLEERQEPPEIGSIITYRFRGKTKNNVPRFATFLRSFTAH